MFGQSESPEERLVCIARSSEWFMPCLEAVQQLELGLIQAHVHPANHQGVEPALVGRGVRHGQIDRDPLFTFPWSLTLFGVHIRRLSTDNLESTGPS